MSKIAQTLTPYPEINSLLFFLHQRVKAALGKQFVGMYLYGSLASGDFDPASGDIDFVVVTKSEPDADMVEKLRAVHESVAHSGNPWASKLEGSYISRAALCRYNPDDPPRPQYNEGQFFTAPHDTDWIIQRHILREHGRVVAGPPLKPMIDPVTPDELRGAVAGILRGWWQGHILTTRSALYRPGYQPYAVLSMCRAQYALRFGEIVSKREAARWALESGGAEWKSLIERALTGQADHSPAALEKTRQLIRHTISAI
jgi:hypothetical protein